MALKRLFTVLRSAFPMTTTQFISNRWFAVVAIGFVAAIAMCFSAAFAQQPCRPINFAAPFPIWGVDSAAGCGCNEVGWDARGMIPWQEFAQGEYIGHARTQHVPEYRIREGDLLAVYYRRTRDVLSRPYELQVGDRIRVESLTAGRGTTSTSSSGEAQPADDGIARELVIQPDGTITLPLLGQVRATRLTVPQLRDELEEKYKKYFRMPAITVTPISVNTRLEDLLNTVDSRAGTLGGLQIEVTVTPAGDIQLPGVGTVVVQNLTPNEARGDRCAVRRGDSRRSCNDRIGAARQALRLCPR